MSGAGGIELVLGVFVLAGYLVRGAVYIAGGAIYLAAKGAFAAGRAIYNAHKNREEKRLKQAKEELSRVQGEIRDMALARHEELAKAETQMRKQYELAVDEREKKMEEAHKKLEGAERKIEEVVMALPKYHEERQKAIREHAEAEVASFSRGMDDVCRKMNEQIETSVEAKKKDALEKLDAVDERLTSRETAYRSYILETRAAALSLMTALESSYDTETYAGVELGVIREELKTLDELLARGDAASLRAAVGVVATLEGRVLSMQVLCERRTAEFAHQKAVLEARGAELQKMVEATHDLKADSEPGTVDQFVTDEHDADFWSGGELGRLWREAEEKMEQVRRMTYKDGQNPAVLAAELEAIRQKLEQVHARTRAFMMSKMVLAKMAKDAIASMKESGWKVVGLRNQGDDPRQAIEIVFTRGEDEMTVVLYDQFDEETRQYKQGLLRLCNEKDEVSEQKREEEDKRFSEAMQKRGHKGFQIVCDKKTAGTKQTAP